VAATPIRRKTAEEVAQAFNAIWLSRFPATEKILSDQGAEFSGAFHSLLRSRGIKRTSTTPYHPQSDGMVERTNQTLAGILSHLLKKSTDDWTQYLQPAVDAMNRMEKPGMTATPELLMLGREVTTLNVIQEQQDIKLGEEEAKRLHSENRDLLAAQHQSSEKNRVAQHFPEFHVGDLVMVRNPAIRQAAYSKFARQWVGPCKVLMKKFTLNYVVRQLAPGTFAGTVHVKNLKRYVTPNMVQPGGSLTITPSSRPQASKKPQKPEARPEGFALLDLAIPHQNAPAIIGPEAVPVLPNNGGMIAIQQPHVLEAEIPEPRPQRQRRPPNRFGFEG
jgi:hypothetical protein